MGLPVPAQLNHDTPGLRSLEQKGVEVSAEKDAKLAKKDRIIAEISEQFVRLIDSDGNL